jgi:hypothetical protein
MTKYPERDTAELDETFKYPDKPFLDPQSILCMINYITSKFVFIIQWFINVKKKQLEYSVRI